MATRSKKKSRRSPGWVSRLQAAVKRGVFTERDRYLAVDWGTCAVGEQPSMFTGIKRARAEEPLQSSYGPPLKFYGSSPVDDKLSEVGYLFMEAVESDRVGDAINAFHAISRRITELKEAA